MIENGNFASGSSSNSDMSRDQNLIEQARQMATPSPDQQPSDPQPPRKSGGNMSRRAFAIGGGLLAVGALGAGAWWMFLRPQDEKVPADPAAAQNPEQEEKQTTKQEKIDLRGEKLTVGKDKDIAPGPWYAEGFLPSADPWLEITHEKESYILEKPTDTTAMDYWANQVTIVELLEGDEICANATLSPVTTDGHLATSLGQIPDLRAGFYVVGIDLEEGEYDLTAHEVIDDIDIKTGAAMEGDLTWPGRVTGAISLAAAAQNMAIEDIENKYIGVIVEQKDKLSQLFGPLFAATLPFSCEALTGQTNPTKTKTETTENKEQQANANANGEQPAANGENKPADQNAATNQENKPAEETKPAENNSNASTNTDPAAAAKPLEKDTIESPAKKAYTLMSKQQQQTLDNLITLLKTDGKFVSAKEKTVTLKANDFVLPIMVDMSLHRQNQSSNNSSDNSNSNGQTTSDATPELTNSTMTNGADASVFS